jgi:hypothetical protein
MDNFVGQAEDPGSLAVVPEEDFLKSRQTLTYIVGFGK